MPLPCEVIEHIHPLPLYSFVTETIDDTKIMKSLPLPSQCDQALSGGSLNLAKTLVLILAARCVTNVLILRRH